MRRDLEEVASKMNRNSMGNNRKEANSKKNRRKSSEKVEATGNE